MAKIAQSIRSRFAAANGVETISQPERLVRIKANQTKSR